MAKQKSSLLDARRDVLGNARSSLSPLTNSLLEQLEARIKELKVWLRDTELLIFNSCLREHKDAAQQLHSFKVATVVEARADLSVLETRWLSFHDRLHRVIVGWERPRSPDPTPPLKLPVRVSSLKTQYFKFKRVLRCVCVAAKS